MEMAMIIVKIADNGNDNDDGNDDDDGNGDDDGNDDDDGIAGKPGCVTNKPKRHHNGRCLPQDWRDD